MPTRAAPARPGGRGPEAGLPRIGVEDEYQLWHRGVQLDVRRVLPALDAWRLPSLDPVDPRARRLPSGHALTADGWELELATPPRPVSADAAEGIGRGLTIERTRLLAEIEGMLGGRVEVLGFSTHVNVSVPVGRELGIAAAVVRHASVATMLLLDLVETPGLVVRPRHHRVEVCLDHLDDDRRTVALTFLAAVVSLLGDAAGARPRALDIEVAPARERYGHYVDRHCAGVDLHAHGRATAVRLATTGAVVTAQDHLEEVWAHARPYAVGLGLPITRVDALVRGRAPLPIEAGTRESRPPRFEGQPGEEGLEPPESARRGPRVIDGLLLQPRWLTWDHVAWEARHPGGRTAYAVLPVEREAEFLAALDAGRLTPAFRRALLPRVFATVLPAPRLALDSDDGGRLRRRLECAELAPPERDAAGRLTPAPAGGGGATGSPGDRAKDRHDEAGRESSVAGGAARSPRTSPRWLVPALVAGLVLVGAGVAAALLPGWRATTASTDPAPGVAASPTSAPEGTGASTPGPTGPSTAGSPGSVVVSGTTSFLGTVVIWGTDASDSFVPVNSAEDTHLVECSAGSCTIRGFAVRYVGFDALTVTGGPTVFTATWGDTDLCGPPSQVVEAGTAVLTLGPDTMVLVVDQPREPALVPCPDGARPVGPARVEFSGVRPGSTASPAPLRTPGPAVG